VEVTLPGQPAVMFGDVTPEFARHLAAACAAGKPLPVEKRVPGIADLARIAASRSPPKAARDSTASSCATVA